MSEELKPCPFCGQPASEGKDWVECGNIDCFCDATMPPAEWNRRADSDRIATLTADNERLKRKVNSERERTDHAYAQLSEAKAEVERLSRRSVMALAADHDNLRDYLGQLEQVCDSLAQRLKAWRECAYRLAEVLRDIEPLAGSSRDMFRYNSEMKRAALAAFEKLQKEEAKS